MAKQPNYDFSGLTQDQEALLTFQGWAVESRYPPSQPSGGTVRKLIDRGLLVPRQRVSTGPLGTMSVTEYDVPIAVHIAWCAYCAKRHGEAA